jgi:hypothetical protein
MKCGPLSVTVDGLMDSKDVPQANRIEALRTLVAAVREGAVEFAELEARTRLSKRHVGYYLHAARILGWVKIENGRPKSTTLGDSLLSCEPKTSAEATVIRKSIRSSPLGGIVPDLFETATSLKDVTGRLRKKTDLSESTAKRRAGTLMRWRNYVLSAAKTLPSAAASKRRSDPPRAQAASMSEQQLAYLGRQLEHGRLILFTGAGFSVDAADVENRKLPSGVELARELWQLCFPDESFDTTSSLQDLYEHALAKQRTRLAQLLTRRLRVNSTSLPDHYRTWFSQPWRRVYTLNVDDLELAAGRQFKLPRKPISISATASSAQIEKTSMRGLHVIHLNGTVIDTQSPLTFSTTQYAERLASQEPLYVQLASDLLAYPFIFVGTPLDEPVLWQHIQLRGQKGDREAQELRPRSFLICPSLPRARRELLKRYNIEWLATTGSQFAPDVLNTLREASELGMQVIAREARVSQDDLANIVDVSDAASAPSKGRTEYLLGAEPTWSDLTSGRAIRRTCDSDIATRAKGLLNSKATRKVGQALSLLVIGGTAGSGKSTSLMRVALELSAVGHRVSWVAADAEVSPRTIREYSNDPTRAGVLAIDTAERYGMELAPIVRDLASSSDLRLVLVSLRSPKLDLLDTPMLENVDRHLIVMPHLTNDDIGALVDTLDSDNRLGRLKGKPRQEQEDAFRERAGRQLLVAMIEATSGKRFDEKVAEEWEGLSPKAQYFYALVAIASTFGHYLSREELLLASVSRGPQDLTAINLLCRRHIVTEENHGARIRARHRVIAETLVNELRTRGNLLANIYIGLTQALALRVRPEEKARNSREWRLLKMTINHEHLFQVLDLEDGRRVYEGIEENLRWDHHYWLQRGTFELEHGRIALAENFLNQSISLQENDAYVQTAVAHMMLKKAAMNPKAIEVETWVNDAVARLKAQIRLRGKTDPYPYHVLGSQALGWARKAPWSKDKKKAFLSDLKRSVDEGAARHRTKRYNLPELVTEIQREILGLAIR